ncbi:MAG: hypothetical protein OXT09_34915 [Myxococcales bacterium]|nr:hypothetical protein [Myxococcales bacterium]
MIEDRVVVIEDRMRGAVLQVDPSLQGCDLTAACDRTAALNDAIAFLSAIRNREGE